jgi:ribosomal protein S18 acetylase RimI-like enzyme
MFRTQEAAGAPFDIVAASVADSRRISDFIAGLSVRTQFLRFFATVGRPSSGLLRALTGTDGRADVLVATDQAGAVVAHGMAADRTTADGVRTSDLGLVVADLWQQRGVGSAMLDMLADRARDRGVGELVMDVQPGNDRMLAMIIRRWPDARRELGPYSLTIRARPHYASLAASPVPPPAPRTARR